MAGALGIEPSSGVLETLILPMNYAPMHFNNVIVKHLLIQFSSVFCRLIEFNIFYVKRGTRCTSFNLTLLISFLYNHNLPFYSLFFLLFLLLQNYVHIHVNVHIRKFLHCSLPLFLEIFRQMEENVVQL